MNDDGTLLGRRLRTRISAITIVTAGLIFNYALAQTPASTTQSTTSNQSTINAHNKWLPASTKSLILRRYYVQAVQELNQLTNLNQNPEAAFWLGQFYQCGKVVDFDCNFAAQLYHKASLLTQSAALKDRAQNELTWLHATCQQADFKNDYDHALVQAKAGNLKSPYRLDTLAAAQAANGQFNEAIATQKKAITALDALAKQATVPLATLHTFKDRLQAYQQKRPAYLNRQNAAQNCTAFPPDPLGE